MLNYDDLYSDFLDLIMDPSIEEFNVTDDHRKNLFYMGMLLLTDKEIKIVNDTKINLYQKMYDYWREKYRTVDYVAKNDNSKYYLIATSGFIKTKKEMLEKGAKEEGDEIFFSTKNAYYYLDNFDYKNCLDNMEKIGESNTVVVKYDRSNISQFLELGVVYCLNNLYPFRNLTISSGNLELKDNDFGDKVIIEMQKMGNPSKKLIK